MFSLPRAIVFSSSFALSIRTSSRHHPRRQSITVVNLAVVFSDYSRFIPDSHGMLSRLYDLSCALQEHHREDGDNQSAGVLNVQWQTYSPWRSAVPFVSIFFRIGDFLSIHLNYERIRWLEDVFSSRRLWRWRLKWLPPRFNFLSNLPWKPGTYYSQERREESSLDKWGCFIWHYDFLFELRLQRIGVPFARNETISLVCLQINVRQSAL